MTEADPATGTVLVELARQRPASARLLVADAGALRCYQLSIGQVFTNTCISKLPGDQGFTNRGAQALIAASGPHRRHPRPRPMRPRGRSR